MHSSELLKPFKIDVQSLSPLHARVVMEPFERGYGHTLGNALRRILLSSMPGCAATEVSIDGVLHEYSTIDGVQEDVVDILLNLKGIVFKLHDRNEVVLQLNKEGEGVVRAGDIVVSHDVEIINPDHVIAHLSAGGKLAMELKVEKARGYIPGNLRQLGDGNTADIGVDPLTFPAGADRRRRRGHDLRAPHRWIAALLGADESGSSASGSRAPSRRRPRRRSRGACCSDGCH